MAEQGSVNFEDVPDACLVDVLKRLDGKSTLRFQAASKRLFSLGQWPSLWASHFESQFGMRLPTRCSRDFQDLLKMFGNMTMATTPSSSTSSPSTADVTSGEENGDVSLHKEQLLSFCGVLTDGGLQDGWPLYWMGSIFSDRWYKGYCSKGKLNRHINCVGAFLPWRVQSRGRVLPLYPTKWSSKLEPDVSPAQLPEEECHFFDERVMVDLDEIKQDASKLAVLHRVIVCRKGRFSCPVQSGTVSIGSTDWTELIAKGGPAERAQVMYKETQSGAVPILGGLNVMEDVLAVCSRGVFRPMRVCWGSNGEWVEFDREGCGPRPVLWFHFYSQTEYDDRQSEAEIERREKLAVGFAGLGALCKTVELKRQRVSEARTFMSIERNRISMALSKPILGNAVYLTLNSFEDIMDQCTWDQSKGPNIDIGKLYLLGQEVQFF
ncbi:hypothetical protein BSKO_09535 [Bryopsis sp. KO-2023]|nr:hypothetical protein BSKO_09535 [Bryopsis sp. KO-2023]